MKKLICTNLLVLVVGVIYSQQWANIGSDIHNTNTGNVGIGTVTPQSKLTLESNTIGDGISLFNSYGYSTIKGNLTTSPLNNFNRFEILSNTTTANGPSISLITHDAQYPFRHGAVTICSYGNSGTGIYFTNYNTTTNTWVDHVSMTKEGKFIIGNFLVWNNIAPGDYKLYVETGILTERVKVAFKNAADWSDYVFAKTYKLMPLNTLKAYIDSASHLPGIPSAEQVVKNGVDLGEMDAKLLGKIEELTLYIIELNQKLEEQKQEIAELRKQQTKTR